MNGVCPAMNGVCPAMINVQNKKEKLIPKQDSVDFKQTISSKRALIFANTSGKISDKWHGNAAINTII